MFGSNEASEGAIRARMAANRAPPANCCHFRDVPTSVILPPHDVCGPSVAEQLRALRATMPLATGRLDFPFSEPEVVGVLKDLPANRTPGPDGLTYENERCGMLRETRLARTWTSCCTSRQRRGLAARHCGRRKAS